MRIIGFSLSKIFAERIKPLNEKLELKSGLNIDDISKEELNISKSDSLRFDFTYNITYNEEAKIEIKGSVIVMDDKDEGKDIIKNWKKKKFDHPMKLPLFNFIMDKCNLKSLQLEEEIGVPFHIPLPKLSAKPNEEGKASYTG
jgi:hypothetical protein